MQNGFMVGIPVFLTDTAAALTAEGENIETAKEAISWFGKLMNYLLSLLKPFAFRLIIAILVLIVGIRFIKWLKKLIKRSFTRANVDEGVEKFLLSFAGVAMNVVLAIITISILGVKGSWLGGAIGSAGLTIGLALQGSLSNFAGGVLILLMKPFRIGDYIIILSDQAEGTVTGIDIFYTRLLTTDNRKIVIPNGGLSNTSIINVTNEENRRLELKIPVGYETNLKKAKDLLTQLLERQEEVLLEEERNVFVDSFGDSAILIGIFAWTKKEDYWVLRRRIFEEIKETFDENGISIPFNKLDVTISKE